MTKQRIEKTLQLVKEWQLAIEQNTPAAEQQVKQKMAGLVNDNQAKRIMVHLLDRSFRTGNNRKVIRQAKAVFSRYGVPSYFTAFERFLVNMMRLFGSLMPAVTAYFLKQRIRRETAGMILPGETRLLSRHILQRKRQNVRLNINMLGELVLGEKEAVARFNEYTNALKNPGINYVSVKISGIYSKLHPLGYDHSRSVLIERMSALYRTALENPYEHNGQRSAKFINLDMEEYKDTRLTLDVFMSTLDQPEFQPLHAGIVIQAYLQDAAHFLRRLTEWAKQRRAAGGAPIKVRIVKGANLHMETFESNLHGWPNPVLPEKVMSDANYKKLMEYALQAENCQAVHIGAASHNLFDLAYAATLVEENGVNDFFTFEMLEGMAETTVRILQTSGYGVLVYAPVAKHEEFLNAVSYLVRRLDENTEETNFLRHSFRMSFGSKEWQFLESQFLESMEQRAAIPEETPRNQDRSRPESGKVSPPNEFTNEPETDFTLPQNYAWACGIRDRWQKKVGNTPFEMPVWVGKRQVLTGKTKIYRDINANENIPVYSVHIAGSNEINEMLEIAHKDPQGWRTLPVDQRLASVAAVANEFRKGRGDLIGCMAAVTGKPFMESDNEISEGIDFAEYYPYSVRTIMEESGCRFIGKGVVLVIAPWNFPMAIPAGGVLAALAAGNTVVLKPAPEAFPVALEFAKHFRQAGIPEEAFQVACCEEGEVLDELVSHPAVNHIIFTGGTDTAKKIMKKRPDIPLTAETGGKNAMIVTSMADWDQAVKDVVHSAFSNSGQKCSCASLLILEEELFESPKFKEKLLDCAEGFTAGSAWDLTNYMGPLIQPPQGKLKQVIDAASPEQWLLAPKTVNGNPYILSPGILWDVTENDFCHQNELFGPVLAVMKAKNLEHALRLSNNAYGLTAGLQSLDPHEKAYWMKHVEAGNLYVNRGITGAIVRRQPFGGIKDSAFGYGIKAGGPNYVLPLMRVSEQSQKPSTRSYPELDDTGRVFTMLHEMINLSPADGKNPFAEFSLELHEYARDFQTYFSGEYDPTGIPGQHNVLKYLTGIPLKMFAGSAASPGDWIKIFAIVRLSGAKLSLYADKDFISGFSHIFGVSPHDITSLLNIPFEEMSESVFAKTVTDRCRIRLIGANGEKVKKLAAVFGAPVINHPLTGNMRTEAVYYMQEQSVSINYHRYGNCNLGE